MRYTIVVPAWNEAAFIGNSLGHIRTAMDEVASGDGAHVGTLVVVDNNSTDRTAEIAREAGATVVFEPVNQIARARNAGARMSTGEALVFVDADSWCSAALLRAALDRLAAGRVVGGGSTIAPDRPIEGGARRGLDFWNRVGTTMKLAAGCFVYCRRDAFDDVGGFSDKVYAGEEIFLSRALKRWGRRRGLRFEIIEEAPVVTSVRKLDWYSPLQLARQAALVFVPGALYSKTLCRTWYDSGTRPADAGRRHARRLTGRVRRSCGTTTGVGRRAFGCAGVVDHLSHECLTIGSEEHR